MKQISIIAALLAAILLSGCQTQQSAPSALDVIMSRTSIRSFTGDPVPQDQLETILKAGMAAPTAMNGQPWRFVVVTDKEKIATVFGAGPRSGMFTTAGAVWTAGYPAEERIVPVAAALGLPENVKPLCIIPVGVPAEDPAPKDKWKPEFIHWEQW